MRIAYFSPLTPQKSGIADYSELLLPHLAEGADITLFVDGFQPTNPHILSAFPVCDYQRDPGVLRTLKDYDAVVYHMGNDHRYHTGIFETMQKHPGIVVFHDFALHDFFLGLARERGDFRIFLDEIPYSYGNSLKSEITHQLSSDAWIAALSPPTDFPLNQRLARGAEAIIVHSQWSKTRFRDIAPRVPIAQVPHGVDPPRRTRSRIADDGEVRLSNFGLINPGKCIEEALRTLAKLKGTHNFRYTLVGEPNSFFPVPELIKRYGMEKLVTITGHVTLDEFEQHIVDTDIALNMREPTVGETSGSLCRILGAGVCSVVSDVGWYGELPDDGVVKIPLNRQKEELLFAYLKRLIEDAPLRERIGANAKRYAMELTFERSAAEYLSFLKDVVARRAHRKLISGVSAEITQLHIHPQSETFLRRVAEDIASLNPVATTSTSRNGRFAERPAVGGNGHTKDIQKAPGRLPWVEGIDYKAAAREYLSKLPEERRHHLRTKPFYNLANKPAKYKCEGMDEDMHRHFCDFANMAMMLALPPGSRILDVGCGSGWLSEYFARLGHEVVGIDISAELVEMSRERVAKVPYGVDHETPLRCSFEVHDIELAPLQDKFDAIVCYDSLHHFSDERAVVRNLSEMTKLGGLLFILEGERPPEGSPLEDELRAVMREFQTLESPFDYEYLTALLGGNGFAVVGDYVSVNGLFDRELVRNNLLPLKFIDTNYHYLCCKKVTDEKSAAIVPDSRTPGRLRAQISLLEPPPKNVKPREQISIRLSIRNMGDTLWLAGQTDRRGVVMPAVKVFDEEGTLINEFHGEPPLARAVSPREKVNLTINYRVPARSGTYKIKIDLVDQQVTWFEDAGSEPLFLQVRVE